MANCTKDQQRIKNALYSFPYSGIVRIVKHDGPLADAEIAQSLENLSETIGQYSEQAQEAERELVALKADIAAAGRVLALMQKK